MSACQALSLAFYMYFPTQLSWRPYDVGTSYLHFPEEEKQGRGRLNTLLRVNLGSPTPELDLGTATLSMTKFVFVTHPLDEIPARLWHMTA